MKNFLLDEKPNFTETSVIVGRFKYVLTNVKKRGYLLTVFNKEYEVCCETALTKDDLKAIFLLLSC